MGNRFTYTLFAAAASWVITIPIFAVGAEEASVRSFRDIPEYHWAAPAMEWAAKEGVATGYEDGTFKPDQVMTRAEFIKMLVVAAMIPHSEGSTPWYESYVYAAEEYNLHDASEFDSYLEPITRFEMIRLALRAVHMELRSDETLNRADWLLMGVEEGLIRGKNQSGELEPDSYATRAESVAFIQRVAQIRSGLKLEPDAAALDKYKSIKLNTLGE